MAKLCVDVFARGPGFRRSVVACHYCVRGFYSGSRGEVRWGEPGFERGRVCGWRLCELSEFVWGCEVCVLKNNVHWKRVRTRVLWSKGNSYIFALEWIVVYMCQGTDYNYNIIRVVDQSSGIVRRVTWTPISPSINDPLKLSRNHFTGNLIVLTYILFSYDTCLSLQQPTLPAVAIR